MALKVSQLLALMEDVAPIKTTVKYDMRLTKTEDDLHLVTGVVFSPNVLDSHNHYMTTDEVRRTAHLFMEGGLQRSIDVMHDHRLIDAVVVESYIEERGTPDIPPGSWVVTTKINDPVTWSAVKRGVLNGYSMEVESYGIEHEAEISYDSWVFGETQPDPLDGHTHMFLVKMDAEGNVARGYTSEGGDDNHRHTISRLSVTDPYNHVTHRIVI